MNLFIYLFIQLITNRADPTDRRKVKVSQCMKDNCILTDNASFKVPEALTKQNATGTMYKNELTKFSVFSSSSHSP